MPWLPNGHDKCKICFVVCSVFVDENFCLKFAFTLYLQERVQVDIPTCHFSERFLFRTVFVPKGCFSERFLFRKVFLRKFGMKTFWNKHHSEK